MAMFCMPPFAINCYHVPLWKIKLYQSFLPEGTGDMGSANSRSQMVAWKTLVIHQETPRSDTDRGGMSRSLPMCFRALGFVAFPRNDDFQQFVYL